jgi:hypothetical protein
VSNGPDPRVLGQLAADHLPPILYALELCAVSMDEAGRGEEARYYRALARRLSDAVGEGSRE